ncbi:MAG: hypothetical protein LBQ52_09875 [Helicobacteraceae bacterium]|nr:hypothetical protein [Helicobacteraceae bacterium]
MSLSLSLSLLLAALSFSLSGCSSSSGSDGDNSNPNVDCRSNGHNFNGIPGVIEKVNFTGQTATINLNSLNANDVYLVKVNKSACVAKANDTGGLNANDTGGLLSATVFDDSQALQAQDTFESQSSFLPMDHIGAMEFNANPPPITEEMRQNRDRLISFAPFAAPSVNDKRNFWVEEVFNGGSFVQKEATLLATGTYSNIWVIDNSITTPQAQALATKFDVIYPIETKLLGYEYGGGTNGDGGRDGDPKIQILVYDINNGNGNVAGFFWGKDFYNDSESKKWSPPLRSNKAEIFYLDAGYIQHSLEFMYSTLIHEFQHMINFNEKFVKRDKNSATWYNEALSMMAEDVVDPLIGVNDYHPIKVRIPTFLTFYDQVGVTEWDNLDSGASYAKGYAFGAYLMRNFGGAQLLKDILANDETNEKSITAALDKFEAGLTFEKALARYGEALVFSGTKKPSGVLSFDNTVNKTIDGTTYTATGFDIWNISSGGVIGPKVFDLSPREMRPHSVRLHSLSAWKNKSGSLSITLEKPANDDVELYIMVR